MGFTRAVGFYYKGKRAEENTIGGFSKAFLHQAQCKVCPLNNEKGLKHPHMEPYGPKDALIYGLGEAPGATEDEKGRPFVGAAGKVLRMRIPKKWEGDIRWNNCVRTRPPKNRDPSKIEVECCRPSIVKDIELVRPRAIFGFGNVPLEWATGETGIKRWSFRRLPIVVGDQTLWFYPMFHPSFVMRTRKFEPRDASSYGSEIEFVFAKNLEWAFRDVLSLPDPVVHTREEAMQGIETITGSDPSHLSYVLDYIKSLYDEDVVGVDYETAAEARSANDRLVTRPYAYGARILTIAIAGRDKALAFALDHEGASWSDKELAKLEKAWRDFLIEAPCRKVAHHAAFEMEWSGFFFGKETITNASWDCTKGQAFMLDERQLGCLSLEFLCQQYFGLNIKEINNSDVKALAKTPVDTVLKYNGLDAKYHRELFFAQDERLDDEGVRQVYKEHMRRVKAAVLTQLQGCPIDQHAVDKFIVKYGHRMKDIEAEIQDIPIVQKFEAKGKKYRPSAQQDVKTIFASLGYTLEHADEDALKGIDHELAHKTIAWRKAKKNFDYAAGVQEGYEESSLFPDGRIHPILSCDKVVTWRTSSEDVNYQNWPKRDAEAKELRSVVRDMRGYKIYSFDYAGIQARNIAQESKDEALIEAFWKNYDIHTDWMERIQRAYPKWCDGKKLAQDKAMQKEYRHLAKNQFVFPKFFGARDSSVAHYLGIPEDVGVKLGKDLWDKFPHIKDWQDSLHEHYKKHGWVTGLSGHRRRAPVAPNQLINAPIQADEALIVCDAMARLCENEDPDIFAANLMVHDDLTFIWPTKHADKYAEVVIDTMVNCPYKWAHIVPIEVEMAVGDDWGSVKDAGKYVSTTWRGKL